MSSGIWREGEEGDEEGDGEAREVLANRLKKSSRTKQSCRMRRQRGEAVREAGVEVREDHVGAVPLTIKRDITLALRRLGADKLIAILYEVMHGRSYDHASGIILYNNFGRKMMKVLLNEPVKFLADYTARRMGNKAYKDVWKGIFRVPLPEEMSLLHKSDFVRSYYQDVLPPLQRLAGENYMKI